MLVILHYLFDDAKSRLLPGRYTLMLMPAARTREKIVCLLPDKVSIWLTIHR